MDVSHGNTDQSSKLVATTGDAMTPSRISMPYEHSQTSANVDDMAGKDVASKAVFTSDVAMRDLAMKDMPKNSRTLKKANNQYDQQDSNPLRGKMTKIQPSPRKGGPGRPSSIFCICKELSCLFQSDGMLHSPNSGGILAIYPRKFYIPLRAKLGEGMSWFVYGRPFIADLWPVEEYLYIRGYYGTHPMVLTQALLRYFTGRASSNTVFTHETNAVAYALRPQDMEIYAKQYGAHTFSSRHGSLVPPSDFQPPRSLFPHGTPRGWTEEMAYAAADLFRQAGALFEDPPEIIVGDVPPGEGAGFVAGREVALPTRNQTAHNKGISRCTRAIRALYKRGRDKRFSVEDEGADADEDDGKSGPGGGVVLTLKRKRTAVDTGDEDAAQAARAVDAGPSVDDILRALKMMNIADVYRVVCAGEEEIAERAESWDVPGDGATSGDIEEENDTEIDEDETDEEL